MSTKSIANEVVVDNSEAVEALFAAMNAAERKFDEGYEKYLTNNQIERNFTYHPVKPGQPEIYGEIRGTAKVFAYLIDKYCPNSREKSLAMTKLEEAVMWANAAIAREEEEDNENE